MCRNYSPMGRLEVERERWKEEHGTDMPKPQPRSAFTMIAPVQMELPLDEDRPRN